jgi:hypothetical protein
MPRDNSVFAVTSLRVKLVRNRDGFSSLILELSLLSIFQLGSGSSALKTGLSFPAGKALQHEYDHLFCLVLRMRIPGTTPTLLLTSSGSCSLINYIETVITCLL